MNGSTTQATPSRDATAGFNPVAFTRAASQSHRNESRWSLFADVYQILFGAAVVLMYIGSLLYGVREELLVNAGSVLTRPLLAERFSGLSYGTASYIFLLLVSLGGLVMACRTGPISVGRPHGYWWLNLPVDRRMILRGPASIRLLRFSLLAGLVFLLVGALSEPVHGVASVALGTAAAVETGGVVFLVAALAQLSRIKKLVSGVAAGALVASLLVVLLPLIVPYPAPLLTAIDHGLMWLPSSWPLLVTHGVLWPLIAAIPLILAGAAAVYVQLGRLKTLDLTLSGAISGHSLAAFYFGDFSEMKHALRTTSKPHRWKVFSANAPKTVAGVLIQADLVALLRSPGKIWSAINLVLLPAAIASVSGLGSAVVTAIVTLGTGWAAAASAASVAGLYASRPMLDRLLPLNPQQALRIHTVIPMIFTAGWGVLSFGLLALLGAGTASEAGGAGLTLMGLLAGLGLAGAGIRGAYQPPPDWYRPRGLGTQKLMPPGIAASFVRGPDFVLLAMIPALVVLVAGSFTWWLLLLQLAASALCLWWGSREP